LLRKNTDLHRFFVFHPERSPEKKHENIYIKKPDNAVNSIVRQQIEKPKSIFNYKTK